MKEYRYYPVKADIYVAGIPADPRDVEISYSKTDKDEELHMYGIYAIDDGGQELHICDCPTEEKAKFIVKMLAGSGAFS